jgi:hypothetical protein
MCVLVLACGPSAPAPTVSGSGPTLSCPAPIGVVPKEDCAAIAADFGAFSVQGALPLAGTGKDADAKLQAIRAAADLAQSIKDRRVKLCERYVKCQVPLPERDAQDQALTAAMASLADLWNKRRFSRRDEIVRFLDAVRAVDHRVNGGQAAPLPPHPPHAFKAEDTLTRVENPDIAFRASSGAVTVSRSTNPVEADALLSKPNALPLAAGHRYRIKVSGSYTPAAPALISPGDDITTRLKYHAEGGATIATALRSLEDPDAEAADSFRAAAGDKATHDVKLSADPAQTGFSVDVAVADAPVEFESIELLRAGKVILAARAGDPTVRTGCATKPAKAHGDAPSLACKPGQRIRVGEPAAYLVLGVRDAGGKRASTATLSLDGGRSVDAVVGEDARFWVALVGFGSATLEQVEVTDLGM